jgi:hypothetical protein
MTKIGALLALCLAGAFGFTVAARAAQSGASAALDASAPAPSPQESDARDTISRLERDLAAMQAFRPAYRFWRHIFIVPDGAVAFGSAADGRLVATFPVKGDWTHDAVWEDPALAQVLTAQRLPRDLSERRKEVAHLLEPSIGPVVHNSTRGLSLLPNARRYGAFLSEWGAIYERFGVPAEIGLAQALVESGLNGTVRSEARAIGFCQWLAANWNRLKRLAPRVIEGYNQTTQAPYCAAYLTILATKYGSFIPALSEHHTGGTNVGRTLINGERLGGADVRERYFLGAAFARDVRTLSPRRYQDVYGTYGPRSFLYAEMVFGNTATIADLMSSIPQTPIFAVRTRRSLPLSEITRGTGLPAEEIRRFNPALRTQVPSGGTLYLPRYLAALGSDVSFWHRPPTPAYATLLDEFLRLDASIEQWDSPAFDEVLADFRKRFMATGTEEGDVMATTLAYVLEDRRTNRQARILAEFRESEHILDLFAQARLERDANRALIEATLVTSN